MRGLLVAAALLGGCAAAPRPVGELARAFQDEASRYDPIGATAQGDRRFDDDLDDLSPEAHRRHLAVLRAIASELASSRATGEDRITADELRTQIDGELRLEACHFQDWLVSSFEGAHLALIGLVEAAAPEDEASVLRLARRLRRHALRFATQYTDGLARGRAAGYVASRAAIEASLVQLDAVLAAPRDETPLAALPATFPAARVAVAREALLAAADAAVLPALRLIRRVLHDELLPVARDQPGLASAKDGAACYAAMIATSTGTDLGVAAIHALGMSELDRDHRAMRALSHADDLRAFDAALAAAAPPPADPLAAAAALLERARVELPRAFTLIPRRPLGVRAADVTTHGAGYAAGSIDGRRPAAVVVDVAHPLPPHVAAVWAFHEGIPGHHLQIALAQELPLPDFRRLPSHPVFYEGWALYAESVAGELGLYRDDAERFAALGWDAWRAARLVVDTGLHAYGWPRERAVQFLLANTLLDEPTARFQVDQAIQMPAYQLAYKLGQREFLALRAEAQRRLGPAFDLRAFHAEVLRHGTVTMPTLREIVRAWLAHAPASLR